MFDFDKIIERKSDKCRKWDHAFVCSRFGDVPQGFIPLWIADMDFTSPPAVIEGFQRIVEHGTFGYTELRRILRRGDGLPAHASSG